MKSKTPIYLTDEERQVHADSTAFAVNALLVNEIKNSELKIPLFSMVDQQRYIFEISNQESIKQLKKNLLAPHIPGQTEIDESKYPRTHLLRECEGWEPPHPDIIAAYFRHFQANFPEYDTDNKLSVLLGLSGNRRVREYKSGDRTIPYGVWRKFLVMTGRASQEIIPVFAFMG